MAVCRLARSVVIVLVLALLSSSAGAAGIVVAQQGGTVSNRTLAVAASTGSVHKAPVNPLWTKYKDDVAAGRVAKQAVTGHGLGTIPGIVDFSHLKTVTPALAQALPAKYDLRTLGKVSPVKDQGQCGSCWSFATYGSFESYLLTAETVDLSENSMKNQHGFDNACCAGGQYLMSTAYLTRWGGMMRSGPVTETCDGYDISCGDSTSCPVQKHVQNAYFLAPRANALNNDEIKTAVQTYGGVYTTMYMDDLYYNANTKSYYYNGDENLNHAVTIVGWNDNYLASKFAANPGGSGAFIVKNSWGTSWGDSGFFYVSYYDTVFARKEVSVVWTAEPTTNYATNYQYDPLGYVGSWDIGSGDTAWGANVFTASTGTLKAVSLYAVATNTEYTIFIYTNPTTSPTSGTLVAKQSGSKTKAGYYTIPLQASVPLTAGQKFSVVIKFRTPDYNWPLATQYRGSGYSSAATNAPGQSYYSTDGSTWNDWDSHRENGNDYVVTNSIKAFADPQAVPTATSITFTSPLDSQAPGQEYTVSGYLRDSNNAGLGPNKPIGLYWHYEGTTTWRYWTTVQTDEKGYFSTTSRDNVGYYLKATFPGDATYATSSSPELKVTIATGSQKTSITFTSPLDSQAPGQEYTVSGYLRDSNNAGLGPNKPIGLYWHYEGTTTWRYWTTVQTDEKGYFSTTSRDNVGYYLKATFPGDATYATSSSPELKVTIQ